ncbi:hypothetical protein F5877DRAFT_77666 [Lentinula edodes]|nr:hypothetical protein F5877DRAFT_77666 [Lentinula edodes]
MCGVVTTLLVLHLFTTLLGHAMPTKKGDSTAAGMQLQQPSHWVNSYKSCNTEKTETINNWILDVFTMTSEAESMTRDHPAFARYFFREDFPSFKDMVQSLNSRSSEALKFNVQCADYGQRPCPPNQWITIDRSSSSIYTIYVCPNTFNFKVTLASKPFDSSENGWCRPPHLLKDYVPQARALLSRMIRIRFQMKGIKTGDYNENDVTLLTAAGHLKSKYTTLLAQWEQTHPHQQGSPPVRPSLNPESYVASIVGHTFPMPGVSKGKKGRPTTQSSISTAAQQRNSGSQTLVPSFPPSHWVNPYRKCNMEKTKMIDNWIMDAFNMTFEAEHITRDHPATWLALDILEHAICICSDMFHHETAKITLASKPFDDSEDGWCRPPPHDLQLYAFSARALLSRMTRIRLRTAEDYREGDLHIWTSARNLKSNYTTLLAQWEQSNPHQRGYPPIPPEHNTESYAASIVEHQTLPKNSFSCANVEIPSILTKSSGIK